MQLQQNLSHFDDAGVAVFAISYDPIEHQAQFAAEFGINFPLLADPDSRVIRAVGILNTLIEPHEEVYGIPFPGSYVVGVDGAIEEKLFFQSYRTRPSAASVLRDTFGIDFEVRHHPHIDVEGDGVSVSATLATDGMVHGETSMLHVDLTVDDGLHIYARPIPDGYVATEVWVDAPDDVEIGAARYPAAVPFRVDGLADDFRVYADKHTRIAIPVANNSRETDAFQIRVRIRYQACSDTECFIPQTRELGLEVPRVPLLRPKTPSG